MLLIYTDFVFISATKYHSGHLTKPQSITHKENVCSRYFFLSFTSSPTQIYLSTKNAKFVFHVVYIVYC